MSIFKRSPKEPKEPDLIDQLMEAGKEREGITPVTKKQQKKALKIAKGALKGRF